MSPERLLGANYDKSADLWSLAIMMIELWTKRHPFYYCCATPIDLIAELEIFDFDSVVPSPQFSRGLRAVLLSVLKLDPAKRADCNEILQSDWFKEFDLDCLEEAHAVSCSRLLATCS